MEAVTFWVLVTCCVISASIAHAKNRSAFGWFFAGLLGIFGIIIVACFPRLLSEDEKTIRQAQLDKIRKDRMEEEARTRRYL